MHNPWHYAARTTAPLADIHGIDDHAGKPQDSGISSQILTPIGTPAQYSNAHADEQLMPTVCVSTTFHPGAQTDALVPDLNLVSCDSVFFHVHRYRILGVSDNAFNGLLSSMSHNPQEGGLLPLLILPESSPVLNVILHTIYGLSCAQFTPSFDTVSDALDALSTYGVALQAYTAPHAPLFPVFMAHAPTRPIDTYALAAAHDLLPLAAAASAHLLAYPLPTLSDALAARIGARYLKRLFFLHFGRTEALKGLLLHPPRAHTPVPGCDTVQQHTLTRAWALASAHIVWDARPNLSTSLMEAVLRPVEKELACAQCKDALHARILQLVAEWSSVKRTI
ncbi:hypothetical protein B0H21DRAFT_744184 [Amylocystis lapponica]|nr:hypothetical protein B0H21DRAFT_744184 [Amylocystis lapponica]